MSRPQSSFEPDLDSKKCPLGPQKACVRPFKKLVIKLSSVALIVLLAIVFYWTTTGKLEFTDWSRVHSMFCCGENTILQWKRMIVPPSALIRVNLVEKNYWLKIIYIILFDAGPRVVARWPLERALKLRFSYLVIRPHLPKNGKNKLALKCFLGNFECFSLCFS